jgi:hypothetical protein
VADTNFLQAALALLGRPGNAVRGALIDGPGGFGQGLSGSHQYDPTELPGINQLPDEGPSIGPLHITPRTVGGFAAGAATDPLTFLGPGLLHSAVGLGGAGLGMLGKGLGEELTARSLGAMSPGVAEGAGRMFQIPSAESVMSQTAGKYAGDAMSDPIEQLLEHANGIQPGHQIVDGLSTSDMDTQTQHALTGQTPPDAEASPVGDQKYAQAKDRLGQTQAKLGEVNGKAIPARQWLTETSKSTVDQPAQSWEDVIGVPKGTSPTDPLVAERQANPRTLKESSPDLSQGPGLTSQYNDETVGFSRQEVMNHLANLESQIQELSRTLTGDKGSRFGDALEKRGQENTLSDWQARRQLAADPALANTQRQELERTSTSSRPGLSPKQDELARTRTAQQLSRDESFRRAPDAQYFNRGTPEAAADEANQGMSLERDNTPHGDPLEEERAAKETQDKFGRQGVGSYQSGDRGTPLGVQDNVRGVGGAQPPRTVIPSAPHDLTRVQTQRISEPTAGAKEAPKGQDAQARAADPNLERELEAIRQLVMAHYQGGPQTPFNRFLGR